MSKYPLVPLQEILEEDTDEIAVDPLSSYCIAGVLSFGKGLFLRAQIAGSDTKYKTLRRLHARRFVMSRLKAFEGAVAIVGDEFEGTLVSAEFPTFRIKEQRADASYIDLVCRWPHFWESLQARSKGVGARRERVHSEDLLSIEVPLPTIDEQRILVARLGHIVDAVRSLEKLTRRAEHLSDVISDITIQRILDQGPSRGWELCPLGEVAEVNPKPESLAPDQQVSFVPMSALDEKTGSIAHAQTRVASEVRRGYKQFRHGDVIFARITPSMQNGKSAVVEGLPTEFGYGSTEFHVLRPTQEVTAGWIHRIVRTSRFRQMAAQRFTGTAGQQRVPAGFLRSVEIPVPSDLTDQVKAVSEIDRILASTYKAREHRMTQIEKLRALVPSMLNAAFSGSL